MALTRYAHSVESVTDPFGWLAVNRVDGFKLIFYTSTRFDWNRSRLRQLERAYPAQGSGGDADSPGEPSPILIAGTDWLGDAGSSRERGRRAIVEWHARFVRRRRTVSID